MRTKDVGVVRTRSTAIQRQENRWDTNTDKVRERLTYILPDINRSFRFGRVCGICGAISELLRYLTG